MESLGANTARGLPTVFSTLNFASRCAQLVALHELRFILVDADAVTSKVTKCN